MRAVVFDFDGTLTYKSINVWKSLWKTFDDIGESSYYRQLFNRFLNNEFTHQEWCDLTCAEFMRANINKSHLIEIAKNTKLISGAKEFFKYCYDNDISLNIVSGSILQVILLVLGDSVEYFTCIKANGMKFDKDGKLCYIKGTKYDYEGKADFINEFVEVTNVKPSEILFVGNSRNDEWAYKAGCKTLCINPSKADFNDRTKWNDTLLNVTDLRQILPYLESNKPIQTSSNAKYSEK